MKTIPGALAAHLGGELTSVAMCWSVIRRDGREFHFTTHDEAVTFEGVRFEPGASYEATAIRSASAMKLDTLEAKGVFDSSAITDDDLDAGLFDGATVKIFLLNWQAPGDGRVLLRVGTIGQVQRGQWSYTAELRGLTLGFQTVLTKVYQPTCRADLGDSLCQVNLAPLTQYGVVASASDRWSFNASGISGAGPRVISYTANTIHFFQYGIFDDANGFLSAGFTNYDEISIFGSSNNNTVHEALGVGAHEIYLATLTNDEAAGATITLSTTTAGYFDFGMVTWRTGANAGVNSEVRAWNGSGRIDLLLPAPNAITLGDTFSITPGCDKRIATCKAKYNNVVNFRGEPFVPGEDAAIAYPNAS